MQNNDFDRSGCSDRLITKIELAARTKVTTRTVDAWMAKGIIPFRKIGRTVRFDWCEVLETLKCRRQGFAAAQKPQPGTGIADFLRQLARAIRQNKRVEGNQKRNPIGLIQCKQSENPGA